MTVPPFAIGEHSFLVTSPRGNLLWDCIPFLDEKTIKKIKSLGGLQAIAISHPHFQGDMIEWSDAFGKIPIYVHAADKRWIMRKADNVVFWKGDRLKVGDFRLVNLGGHFDGGTVLYWPNGAKGKGVVLSSDIIQVTMDMKSVSFMYSYTAEIPLPIKKVKRIVKLMQRYQYDRIYGSFGRYILSGGKKLVDFCADRYIKHLSEADGR